MLRFRLQETFPYTKVPDSVKKSAQRRSVRLLSRGISKNDNNTPPRPRYASRRDSLAPLVLRIVQVLSRDVSDVLDVSRMSQMCRMLQMLQMDGIRSGCLGCCPDVDGMLQILKLSR